MNGGISVVDILYMWNRTEFLFSLSHTPVHAHSHMYTHTHAHTHKHTVFLKFSTMATGGHQLPRENNNDLSDDFILNFVD